ncbi:MAG TPA: TIR domain-containing protein [Euzebyales bacterium]
MTASADPDAARGAPADAFDVFLSHNSRDKAAVERVARRLREMGLRPWLDVWELAPGSPWQTALEDGLLRSAACAMFIGPNGIGDWAREELHVALDRAAKESGFRLVPVLLPGLPDPLPDGLLPPFLTNRTWVDLRAGALDAESLQALASAIKGVPAGATAVPGGTTDVAPYLGLRPFDEDDAHVFFGRDAETQRLVELLKSTNFLTVVGSSGSGKSSLVRAGLIPALRAGALPRSERWLIRTLRPGATPLTALAAELARADGSRSMQATVDGLADDPRSLGLASALLVAEREATDHVLWVVDQFEEVFTLCSNEDERSAFVANLLYAGTVPDGSATIVLTLRADFYGHCSTYPELARYAATHQFLVSPMATDDQRLAIEQPALTAGLQFEEGLVDVIVEDVVGQPGALPLLEHALFELWKRRLGNMLTLEGYRDTGGVSGAVATRADAIYASLDPAQQQVMRDAILRLTQPGDATEATRRRARWAELDSAASDRVAFEHIVSQLVDARLLITSGSGPEDRWVDVSHEALIRAWPRLKSWVEEDRASLLIHRRMTEAAQEWVRLDHDDGALYRGARLDEVLAWTASRHVSLSDTETAFFDASVAVRDQQRRAAEEQRQRELDDARQIAEGQRKAARLFRAVAVVLLLGLAGSLFLTALVLRRSATARSRGLALAAQATLDVDPELTLLLGREAWDVSHTDEALRTLREGLIASNVRVRFPGDGSRLNVADLDPSGRLAVAASEDGGVWLWNPRTGETERELTGHDGAVRAAEFSPDGKALVTGGSDGTAIVWDVATGRLRAVLRGHSAALRSARFNDDGSLVVTASDDGTAAVWRSDTGVRVGVLRDHRDVVAAATFVPGRDVVVTASFDGTGRIWRWSSDEVLAPLDGHTDRVRDVVASPDGSIAVTVSDDGTARIFSVPSGALREALPGQVGRVIRAVFSPGGDVLVTTGTEGTVRVWDVGSGTVVREMPDHDGFVRDADFSADGLRLATTGADTTVRIWDMSRRRDDSGLLRLRGDLILTMRGHGNSVSSGRFSPDGRTVVSASFDGTARIWSTTSEEARVFSQPGGVGTAALSPDGRFVTTIGNDGTARVWRASDGRELSVLDEGASPLVGASFDSRSRRLVTGGLDGITRVWDVATGQEIHALTGHEGAVSDAVFTPDGRVVVSTGEDGTVGAWDADTGRRIGLSASQTGPTVLSRLAPDGSMLATATDTADGTVVVWDIDDRVGVHRRLEVTHGHEVLGLAFTPSADALIAVGRDSDGQMWATDDGHHVRTFPAGQGTINAVDVSPDGTQAVFAGASGDAWVYTLGDTAAFTTLSGHRDDVVSARFTADGDTVLTSSLDGSARVWNAGSGEVQSVLRTTRRGLVDAVDDRTGQLVLTTGPSGTAWLFRCRLCVADAELVDLVDHRTTRDLTSSERATFDLE